jgi:hypothetical protein
MLPSSNLRDFTTVMTSEGTMSTLSGVALVSAMMSAIGELVLRIDTSHQETPSTILDQATRVVQQDNSRYNSLYT